jgi:hypothetical protein
MAWQGILASWDSSKRVQALAGDAKFDENQRLARDFESTERKINAQADVWAGLTAGGSKAAAAAATQHAFDAQQAKARDRRIQRELDFQNPAVPVKFATNGDGHFDGGNVAHFDCTCTKSRPGKLGLLRRQDGSIDWDPVCAKCGGKNL